MLEGIGERNAGRADSIGEMEVKNEVCIMCILLFGDVDRSYTQHGVVLQHSPQEAARRVVVLAVVDGGGCR